MIQTSIRERYTVQPLATRLGNLAADLARIGSIATIPIADAVQSLLEESKAFIEWSAPDCRPEDAARLVEIQLRLADWHYRWPQAQNDPVECEGLAKQAQVWSDEILGMSGLLR